MAWSRESGQDDMEQESEPPQEKAEVVACRREHGVVWAPMVLSRAGTTAASVCPSLGSSPRAGSGVARQRFHVGDKLAAAAAVEGCRNAHLDAELIGFVGLAFPDAFNSGACSE